MKNRLIILIIYICFNCNLANSDIFKFKTKNLVFDKNENKIFAGKGTVFSNDENLEIEANKFEYDRDKKILKVLGNGKANLKSENLIIEFNEATFNQKDNSIFAEGDVNVFGLDKEFTLRTDMLTYQKEINLISSNTKTYLEDNQENKFIFEKFSYNIDTSILKANNLNFIDNEKNKFLTPLAFINIKSGNIFGKDVRVDLNNSEFNQQNQPRLKGKSLINNKAGTKITKGVFTTCRIRDDCPPWQLQAEEIYHDKKKKTVNYKNALLRVYDLPVMYFPRFFHPDPTVKRKSGFLIPTIKNSPTSDNFLNIPYFLALAENKDITISPRLYFDNQVLLQTEYRQLNKSSFHIADFSVFNKRNSNSKSHFFYNYDKSIDFTNFDTSKINFKIQKTSNDNYLKSNKIETKLLEDRDFLENSFDMNLYSNDLSVNLNTTIYENLNKDKSDRYEYILPKINLTKKIETKDKLNGNMYLKSQSLMRNYDTNVYDRNNINDLTFTSFPKITKLGLYNNYEFLIKNVNSNNQNSSYKNKSSVSLSSIFQYNSSLPMVKENENFKKNLKPKLSVKIAPNHTKNLSEENDKININNAFSLNRISDNETIEGGISMTYGSDYSITNKNTNKEIFNLKLANNLRFEENDDLPNRNQIGEKTSNFFSEIVYTPNDYIKTKYITSLRNNLKDQTYENLLTEIKVNNFVTTFDYLNENNELDENSYLTNTSTLYLDDSNNISFSTRKNKSEDLTEYYKLIYEYKNDCLAASIEYNKDYYSDRDLKPDESLFFKLTIIPFGESGTPNLKK